MTQSIKGVLAMVVACVMWGLSPLLYKALSHVPALEVLSHRNLWGMVFFLGILAFQHRLKEVIALFRWNRSFAMMCVAALLIATNWLVFIAAIQSGYGVEASLGYYIFPLLAVLLGVVVFREKLTRWQMMSVGIAVCAVVTLTLGLGIVPVIALILASSFSVYGALKKRIAAGPVLSVCIETMVLAPMAALVLIGAHFAGWGADATHRPGAFGGNFHDTVLLIISGPVTALPLMFLSYASKRVALATIGLVQYLNPTLQVSVAVFIFSEPFTIWHMLTFGMIWIALAIYSIESIQQEIRRKR